MNTQDRLNFVNGAFAPAKDGAWLDDLAPATGQVIARIPRSTKADVDAAVAAAKTALPAWAKTPVAERAALLDRVADLLEARLDEIAEVESRDTGKPLALAMSLDIPRAISNFRFFADLVRTKTDDASMMADALNYTHRSPVGVCALVTPWNLPLYLLSWKTAPALAMGNTLVAKPSELTPLTASLLAEILNEAGCPPGVFNLVHGLGAEAGDALVSHPDVALVSFTGGTATGAKVAAAAAPQFKKLSLELGGKNPSLVFADCDFEKTVPGVTRSAFLNQGQICLCGSRILVERSIHDRFVDALLEELKAWKVGDPSDPATKIGAGISAAHRDKVEGYFNLALEEGGTIRCGGHGPRSPRRCEMASSWSPPSSRACPPLVARPRRRFSALSSPCIPSTPKTKHSRWPTAPSTASPPASGLPISPARIACRRRWRAAWCGLTPGCIGICACPSAA